MTKAMFEGQNRCFWAGKLSVFPRKGGYSITLILLSTGSAEEPKLGMASSNGARTKWLGLFTTKGVVSCCFTPSSVVCISTYSRCPLHQPNYQIIVNNPITYA